MAPNPIKLSGLGPVYHLVNRPAAIPHFWMALKPPGAAQTPKTDPKNSGQTAFRYPGPRPFGVASEWFMSTVTMQQKEWLVTKNKNGGERQRCIPREWIIYSVALLAQDPATLCGSNRPRCGGHPLGGVLLAATQGRCWLRVNYWYLILAHWG